MYLINSSDIFDSNISNLLLDLDNDVQLYSHHNVAKYIIGYENHTKRCQYGVLKKEFRNKSKDEIKLILDMKGLSILNQKKSNT